MHEAVQLVEEGEGKHLLAGHLGEVHGRRKLVRRVVGDLEEAGADWLG